MSTALHPFFLSAEFGLIGRARTGCHETMARAARLEREVLMTLWKIGFSGLQDGPGSQHGVALVVATLPQRKGQRDSVLGEA